MYVCIYTYVDKCFCMYVNVHNVRNISLNRIHVGTNLLRVLRHEGRRKHGALLSAQT